MNESPAQKAIDLYNDLGNYLVLPRHARDCTREELIEAHRRANLYGEVYQALTRVIFALHREAQKQDEPVPLCSRCLSPDHHVSDCPENGN
jgi:hypothetical protein